MTPDDARHKPRQAYAMEEAHESGICTGHSHMCADETREQ